MKRKRIVIHAKDIQRITCRSIRFAQNTMADMKIYFGKEKHQEITFAEYSVYSGIPLWEIDKYLEDDPS